MAIFHVLVKLPIGCQLHKQIYFIFVAEERIKFDKVGMAEEHLNFYLADQLVDQFLSLFLWLRLNISFLDDFRCKNKTSLDMPEIILLLT